MFSGVIICLCFINYWLFGKSIKDIWFHIKNLILASECFRNYSAGRWITWWRGRPTMDGKTALGASSPAKPALHIPEPLSTTRAATSSSHILVSWFFNKNQNETKVCVFNGRWLTSERRYARYLYDITFCPNVCLTQKQRCYVMSQSTFSDTK